MPPAPPPRARQRDRQRRQYRRIRRQRRRCRRQRHRHVRPILPALLLNGRVIFHLHAPLPVRSDVVARVPRRLIHHVPHTHLPPRPLDVRKHHRLAHRLGRSGRDLIPLPLQRRQRLVQAPQVDRQLQRLVRQRFPLLEHITRQRLERLRVQHAFGEFHVRRRRYELLQFRQIRLLLLDHLPATLIRRNLVVRRANLLVQLPHVFPHILRLPPAPGTARSAPPLRPPTPHTATPARSAPAAPPPRSRAAPRRRHGHLPRHQRLSAIHRHGNDRPPRGRRLRRRPRPRRRGLRIRIHRTRRQDHAHRQDTRHAFHHESPQKSHTEQGPHSVFDVEPPPRFRHSQTRPPARDHAPSEPQNRTTPQRPAPPM